MSGIAFQNVAGVNPPRTRFDWHTSKKFDCSFGQLIPVFKQRCYPGDYFNISNEILVRCLPLINPVMHEVTIDTHYFFIPCRIIDDTNSRPGGGNPKGDPLLLNGALPPAERFNFELFITGGHDGLDNQEYPTWLPTGNGRNINGIVDSYSKQHPDELTNTIKIYRPAPYKHSLWDYFDLPILEIPDTGTGGTPWSSPILPMDDLRRSYNYIYNEYYRDQTLQPIVPWNNEMVKLRGWKKDYFTSALPFQQRGLAPAIPIELTVKDFSWDSNTQSALYTLWEDGLNTNGVTIPVTTHQNASTDLGKDFLHASARLSRGTGANNLVADNLSAQQAVQNTNAWLQALAKRFSGTSINFSELREIGQLQRYLELNARAGARLQEYTKAHWGTSMGDERIGKPEYIGGTKQPLIISEVLQTSETSNQSPLATMGGHGISAYGNHVGDYEVKEWGWIIGIMSIMPQPAYHQGIDKNLVLQTRLDWLSPEFVNLSEDTIKQFELFIKGDSTDESVFGFQAIFDELRTQKNVVNGNFHDTLMDWHLTRHFENAPELNGEFIECNPIPLQRIFAQQLEPNLLVDIEHNFYAVRPIPEIAEPGLLDHTYGG